MAFSWHFSDLCSHFGQADPARLTSLTSGGRPWRDRRSLRDAMSLERRKPSPLGDVAIETSVDRGLRVIITRSILHGYFNPLVFWYQWEYLLTSKEFDFLQGI